MATAPGQKSRPTVVVTTDFELYLGNETDMEIQVKNLDIFGFHLGDFESKMVTGPGPGAMMGCSFVNLE